MSTELICPPSLAFPSTYFFVWCVCPSCRVSGWLSAQLFFFLCGPIPTIRWVLAVWGMWSEPGFGQKEGVAEHWGLSLQKPCTKTVLFLSDSLLEAQVMVMRLPRMLYQNDDKRLRQIHNYTPGLSTAKVTVVCKGLGQTCEKDPLSWPKEWD